VDLYIRCCYFIILPAKTTTLTESVRGDPKISYFAGLRGRDTPRNSANESVSGSSVASSV